MAISIPREFIGDDLTEARLIAARDGLQAYQDAFVKASDAAGRPVKPGDVPESAAILKASKDEQIGFAILTKWNLRFYPTLHGWDYYALHSLNGTLMRRKLPYTPAHAHRLAQMIEYELLRPPTIDQALLGALERCAEAGVLSDESVAHIRELVETATRRENNFEDCDSKTRQVVDRIRALAGGAK